MNRIQESQVDSVNKSLVPPGDTKFWLNRQTSSPIPIKVSAPIAERSPNVPETVDPHYYNNLTWRMYNRITEARRIKAYACQSSGSIDEGYILSKRDKISTVCTID
jgi:hypothetical protein